MLLIFIISIWFVFYAYFGYPLSLIVLGYFKKNIIIKDPDFIFPPATLIITVHNEEQKIREKLCNTMKLVYPDNKLQIIVASDGSTDNTNQIVKEFEKHNIQLYNVKERGGKENAQKEALSLALGDIIVFSDVSTILDPTGIKDIVLNFSDPSVGCVSSEDKLIGKYGEICGEGIYVKYEMWLRRHESKINSIVGLSGSFFAARKEVCKDFSADVQSDFRTLLSSIKTGYRGVTDPDTIGYYPNISDEKKEYNRKIRTILRGLTVFFQNLQFLNIFKYRLFSYQYFCHKFLRWSVPFFLIIIIIANIIFAFNSIIFLCLLICQLIFYGIGILGWKSGNYSSILIKLPAFFLIANTSIFIAWWYYLSGKRIVLWTPTAR